MDPLFHTDDRILIDDILPDALFEHDDLAEVLSVHCERDYRSRADLAYLAEMIGGDR